MWANRFQNVGPLNRPLGHKKKIPEKKIFFFLEIKGILQKIQTNTDVWPEGQTLLPPHETAIQGAQLTLEW